MKAELVYDGKTLSVPKDMGLPKADQLSGTPEENLTELAGRVCYDSLGKGRSSEDFHKNILKVRHHSIYQHLNFVVLLPKINMEYLINRPGVIFWPFDTGIRVSLNLCSTIEWNEWGLNDERLTATIHSAGHSIAPGIVQHTGKGYDYKIDEPYTGDEKWISLYLRGSRGFSHEQVTHSWCCARSQRSTRYVDENGSTFQLPPILSKYAANLPDELGIKFRTYIASSWEYSQGVYNSMYSYLFDWLVAGGESKGDARKIAREAARAFLMHGLDTQMIFSASVNQWKRMLRARCSPWAGGEIRQIYCLALGELKKSQYAEDFGNMEIKGGILSEQT